ncbi:MAG: class I SAM-dependent DNA methyltransferase [Ilumatobacteraceae bacterium]
MEGYGRSSYGDAFADVYDEWYSASTDPEPIVELVTELAGLGGAVLELGVGTGRLAVPLAARGLAVHGVDASSAMLDRLRTRDPDRLVTVIEGDMVDDLPSGPFDVVLVAYNTFFNLESAERQAACFAAVAERLGSGGRFVIDAFVPEDPPRTGTVVAIRTMTAQHVVLSISDHDPEQQHAAGHLVQLVDGQPVRLRPWVVRYAPPSELDELAGKAGLRLEIRWEDADRRPFDSASPRHVSVYARRD